MLFDRLTSIMKNNILNILQNITGPISGEILGKELGITRVAVWKHIQGLISLGYNIETSSEGYFLLEPGDFLYPWEFNLNDYDIIFQNILNSTMDEAKRKIYLQKDAHMVFISDRQTAGRGRMGRIWESQYGGLYFTVNIKQKIPSGLLWRYSIAAVTALAEVLNEHYGMLASVKWPNDVFATDGKIAGVLVDTQISGDMAEWINIGIGLNVNNHPLEEKAVSMKGLTGKTFFRKEILSFFIHYFNDYLKTPFLENAISKWKTMSKTLGQRVIMHTHIGDKFSGTALDIDENGGLMVKGNDGKIKSFLHADCFYAGNDNNKAMIG